MSFWVYILYCADDSFYTGSTDNLEKRLYQHQTGYYPTCFTFNRRPVELSWFYELPNGWQALSLEHQIKKWKRAKKLALIAGDEEARLAASVSNTTKRRRERRQKVR